VNPKTRRLETCFFFKKPDFPLGKMSPIKMGTSETLAFDKSTDLQVVIVSLVLAALASREEEDDIKNVLKKVLNRPGLGFTEPGHS